MSGIRGHKGRVDSNQSEIVSALRGVGAVVQSLASVGDGCADLLVGFRGRLFILEIKLPGERLTPAEMVWHLTWEAFDPHVVRSVEEALEAIRATARTVAYPLR